MDMFEYRSSNNRYKIARAVIDDHDRYAQEDVEHLTRYNEVCYKLKLQNK